MELTVRFADAGALSDSVRFAAAYAAVPAERRARVDRMRDGAAQRLSLAAGALLQEMLADAGVSGAEAEIALGAHGKPYLPRRPDVCFSLSHSGARVMCALADVPVGCDVQRTGARSLAVARRFFSAAERRAVFSQPGGDAQLQMFYRIWTLKESFLKCLGLGLEAPLAAFSAVPDGDRIALQQSFDTFCYVFSEPDAGADYRSAVCIRER